MAAQVNKNGHGWPETRVQVWMDEWNRERTFSGTVKTIEILINVLRISNYEVVTGIGNKIRSACIADAQISKKTKFQKEVDAKGKLKE